MLKIPVIWMNLLIHEFDFTHEKKAPDFGA